ncbi:MAG: putative nucleic acid-binding protein contains PIN [Planctomycetota bacterium]|nr:MAG: putative nucleic acid-binding protein contains PIN [Planctomycetota bacterium]
MLLVDAGPLVALLRGNDERHADCVKVLKTLREPMFTVWPAVTEAMHLLSFSRQAQDILWEKIVDGRLVLLPLTDADCGRMRQLMEKYRDLPMDLADAGLVCVAEREKIARIFTIDRRDFERYRPRGIGHFTLLP